MTADIATSFFELYGTVRSVHTRPVVSIIGDVKSTTGFSHLRTIIETDQHSINLCKAISAVDQEPPSYCVMSIA